MSLGSDPHPYNVVPTHTQLILAYVNSTCRANGPEHPSVNDEMKCRYLSYKGKDQRTAKVRKVVDA